MPFFPFEWFYLAETSPFTADLYHNHLSCVMEQQAALSFLAVKESAFNHPRLVYTYGWRNANHSDDFVLSNTTV